MNAALLLALGSMRNERATIAEQVAGLPRLSPKRRSLSAALTRCDSVLQGLKTAAGEVDAAIATLAGPDRTELANELALLTATYSVDFADPAPEAAKQFGEATAAFTSLRAADPQEFSFVDNQPGHDREGAFGHTRKWARSDRTARGKGKKVYDIGEQIVDKKTAVGGVAFDVTDKVVNATGAVAAGLGGGGIATGGIGLIITLKDVIQLARAHWSEREIMDLTRAKKDTLEPGHELAQSVYDLKKAKKSSVLRGGKLGVNTALGAAGLAVAIAAVCGASMGFAGIALGAAALGFVIGSIVISKANTAKKRKAEKAAANTKADDLIAAVQNPADAQHQVAIDVLTGLGLASFVAEFQSRAMLPNELADRRERFAERLYRSQFNLREGAARGLVQAIATGEAEKRIMAVQIARALGVDPSDAITDPVKAVHYFKKALKRS
jgi:hypothetical protein